MLILPLHSSAVKSLQDSVRVQSDKPTVGAWNAKPSLQSSTSMVSLIVIHG